MNVIATDARAGIKDSFQQTVVGAVISLIEVDCTSFGGNLLRFHNHAMTPIKISEDTYEQATVSYGGVEYSPYPYEITGVSFSSNTAPTPTLTVGNVDNMVSALCLEYDNLVNAKVTITTTMAEYLDTGATPRPDECIKSTWYVTSKTGESDESVSFKLSTPADVEGNILPSRVIMGVCTWALRGWYRSGRGCGYMGFDMFDEDDNPTLDPSKDVCSGSLNSCQIRFKEQPLDFGSFPAAAFVGR